jgi:hypothetical protein
MELYIEALKYIRDTLSNRSFAPLAIYTDEGDYIKGYDSIIDYLDKAIASKKKNINGRRIVLHLPDQKRGLSQNGMILYSSSVAASVDSMKSKSLADAAEGLKVLHRDRAFYCSAKMRLSPDNEFLEVATELLAQTDREIAAHGVLIISLFDPQLAPLVLAQPVGGHASQNINGARRADAFADESSRPIVRRKRKPGPPPVQRTRVQSQMRADFASGKHPDLPTWKIDAIAAEYNTSKTTAADARRREFPRDS